MPYLLNDEDVLLYNAVMKNDRVIMQRLLELGADCTRVQQFFSKQLPNHNGRMVLDRLVRERAVLFHAVLEGFPLKLYGWSPETCDGNGVSLKVAATYAAQAKQEKPQSRQGRLFQQATVMAEQWGELAQDDPFGLEPN